MRMNQQIIKSPQGLKSYYVFIEQLKFKVHIYKI